ncbi:SixA phosphatase family protein [Propylenella binzhouense]|uniref:Histidine phosphatase family protein n=1 Tax=Propylenella binzhouense TaxID=2555902 RepID=A0A964T7L0_9HYPH|nr:histidine phosphatase family protein [Propylenella binzhouense]MYZ49920.1 histidine phosphatase family protein [Propylenella binzhouense]
MPRLMLLRHAKSARPEGVPDRARPLSERGRSDAAGIGRAMAARGLQPDAVICSPAERTRETLDAILPHLAPIDNVKLVNELYEAESGTLLALARAEAGDSGTLLVVGHNPSIEEAALALAAKDEPSPEREAMAEKYPTGALAVFEFDGGWAELGSGAVRLLAFLRPRDLKSPEAR